MGSKSICGFCRDGIHDNCVGRYQRWYPDYKKVGKVKVFTVVYLDDYNECICPFPQHKEEK